MTRMNNDNTNPSIDDTARSTTNNEEQSDEQAQGE